MLGISPRAVEKQIARLREEGRVRRIGPDKGGHWEVVK
jgi:ATP-dependent DNA helicase RecG